MIILGNLWLKPKKCDSRFIVKIRYYHASNDISGRHLCEVEEANTQREFFSSDGWCHSLARVEQSDCVTTNAKLSHSPVEKWATAFTLMFFIKRSIMVSTEELMTIKILHKQGYSKRSVPTDAWVVLVVLHQPARLRFRPCAWHRSSGRTLFVCS